MILCPVSIQYDKVIESRGYVEEMMGQPKTKESLSGLFGQTSVLGLKLGRIDVRFQGECEPVIRGEWKVGPVGARS